MTQQPADSHPDHPEQPDQPQQPDQPEPPGAAAHASRPDGDAPAPPKSRRILKAALAVIAAVVVAIGVRVVIGEVMGEDVPEQGTCLSAAVEADEVQEVDCDGDEAAYRVIGNDGTWVEQEFKEAPSGEVCQDHPGWFTALWVGEETNDLSGDGEVVCLERLG